MLDDLFEMFEQKNHNKQGGQRRRDDRYDSGHNDENDREFFEDDSFSLRNKKTHQNDYNDERFSLKHGHFPLAMLLKNKTMMAIACVLVLVVIVVLAGLVIWAFPLLKQAWGFVVDNGIQGVIKALSTWLNALQGGKG